MALDFAGKRVLVMGLGLHGGGLGVTRWLLRQGARVTVTDLKTAQQLRATLDELDREPGSRDVKLVLGEHREDDFTNADLIVRNPGVPRESPYLQLAHARGIPVRMELGLFFELLPRGAEQVIGITGTKGKTTTTLMTGAILKQLNPRTVVAGNLRVSALELLDRIDAATPVVLEMSSFQLEEFQDLKLSPHLAAITNIMPDHLNRYRDLDEYARTKAQIFMHQQPRDHVVLNFDNPLSTRLRPRAIGQVVWFSRTRALKTGARLEGDWLVWIGPGGRAPVLPVADLIEGAHNIENALAAVAITATWGAPLPVIADALRAYRGAPHRQELVAIVDGVRYINDTTATAPAATEVALATLGAGPGTIYLMAGGADKGLPYEGLARAILAHRVSVILLSGNATERIEGALVAAGGEDRIVARAASMAEALAAAHAGTKPGDTVLLSPGAASFGMFANEFERGDSFRRLVQELAAGRTATPEPSKEDSH